MEIRKNQTYINMFLKNKTGVKIKFMTLDYLNNSLAEYLFYFNWLHREQLY